MFDLIIRNGRIIDGTGKAAFDADIGISDGRVVEVGAVAGPAATEIDADGLVIAPGFIDIHTHYDAQAFWDPKLSPSSNHGVTTVLAGNCGFSIAPLSGRPEDAEYMLNMLSRVEGMPVDSLREGVPWNWTSFDEYLEKLDGTLAINAGFLVGHSAIRRAVMGERAVGAEPSSDEMEQMKSLLATSIAEGALGFSTTISPTHNDAEGKPVPSRHASTEELVELARVAGTAEGTFLEMVVNMTTPFSDETRDRLTLMSQAAGRSINWNVLSPNSRQPQIYENQLAAADHARENGARVYALVTPTPPSIVVSFATGMVIDAFPGLREVMALPIAERKRMLSDTDLRIRLNESMNDPSAGLIGNLSDWSQWRIVETALEKNACLNGELVGTLASRLHKAPLDAMLDLAIEEDLKTLFMPVVLGSDEASWDMRARAWRDPRALIGGSDAGAHLDMIDTFAFSSQLLAEGVRKRNIFSLEEAVHRITGLPAATFGLKDRGTIARGNHADIVIFDPQTVAPGPIYSRQDLPGGGCRLYCDAIGVRDVIVNGIPIIRDSEFTDASPGQILRSGEDTYTVSI